MEISLNRELEQIINRQVQSGNYPSPEEVIRTAVLLLEQRERIGQTGPDQRAGRSSGPRRSPRGILADIRSYVSPDDIQEARQEMWAGFPRDEG